MPVEYRCCALLKDHIALGAVFKCLPAPREEIEKRMKELQREALGLATRRAERRLHVQKSGNDLSGQID